MIPTNGSDPSPMPESEECIDYSTVDPDYILINRDIDRSLYENITEDIRKRNIDKVTKKKCIVFLTTYGGDPHAAYRVGRCLRHTYKYVRVVIPSICKSAGTLLAICGNELAVGDMGELGPLDIQVRKADELSERSSGLDILNSFSIIQSHSIRVFVSVLQELRYGAGLSTRLASSLAVKMAIGASRPLYEQIDPIRAAEMNRAVRISVEYGRRLNEHSKNLQNGALERLTTGYPDHGFVIDRKEAKALFNKVDKLSKEEMFICDKYGDCVFDVMTDDDCFGPCFLSDDDISKLGEEREHEE